MAVDARVEVVEPDHHPIERVAADDLLGDLPQLVVEEDDVVAVPADGAGHVQRDLIEEEEHRGELIRDHLGGVEVAVVQQAEHAVLGRVIHIELVGTDRAALHADAEHLAFDRVGNVPGCELFGVDLVERLLEAAAGAQPGRRGRP